MTAFIAPYLQSHRDIRSVMWSITACTIYKLIPSPAYRTRRLLLALFGAKLDPTARIRGGVRISAPWNLCMGRKSSIGEGATVWAHAPITIGARSVISQYCFVHSAKRVGDHEEPYPIAIGDDVWIAAESVIVGDVQVPNGVLVGARSLVRDPIEPWTIATGHPASSRRERPYRGHKS